MAVLSNPFKCPGNAAKFEFERVMCVEQHETLDMLQESPAFASIAGLPDAAAFIAQLSARLETRDVPRGTIVIEKGDTSSRAPEMYFVKAGAVAVHVELEHPPVTQLGPGESFGEVALMREDNPSRNAYVKAIRETVLYVLHKTALQEAVKPFPDLRAAMAGDVEVLTERRTMG